MSGARIRGAVRRVAGLGVPVLVALALWQAVVWLTGVPHFILPSPRRVGAALLAHGPMLAEHARFTLANLALGLAAGIALGVITALNLALSPMARRLMRPVLVAAQAMPVFALAPILTLWLGYGAPSKVMVVALVVYFPVTSVLFDALMRPPSALDDLARMMRARPWPELWLIRLPHALPALGSGLRLAAVQAPFAVIIGEWVGSSRGLGHLMLMANGRGQTDLMFAALMVLAAMGAALFAGAGLVQRALERGRP